VLVAWVVGASVESTAACSGQTADQGVTEPIQVSATPGQAAAQFVAGPLPGTPPFDAGPSSEAGEDGGGHADGGAPSLPPLTVTMVTFTNPFITSGYAGTKVLGDVTSDAVAVGVQLADQGTGYWVVPTQGADVNFPGQSVLGFSVSFNRADTAGFTNLRLVGISASGSAGLQVNAPICIQPRVPDNGHACSPPSNPRPVPAAVLSLTWDTAFDLDLVVITPSGRNVNPKSDTTTAAIVDSGSIPVPAPASVGLFDGTIGVIDRDSMGECVVDGWREEDLVFQDYPSELGNYLIYADPFQSCGQAAVRFTLTIWEPGSDGNLHATFTSSGELLSSQTTGGEPPDGASVAGLYIAEKAFD
jgi:hypothetical protein